MKVGSLSLTLHVTLANIDCHAADDDDRIAAYQANGVVALQLCGHPSSKVRFCIDQCLTSSVILDFISSRSGNDVVRGDLHAGVSTKSAVESPLVIVPVIDGIVVGEFQLGAPIELLEPTTVQVLAIGRGQKLATSVA